MKKLLLFLFIINTLYVNAQSATLTPGSAGNVQLPKLSYEQIQAIPNPKAGMMVFDSTFGCLKFYDGIKWLCNSEVDGNRKAIGFAWQSNIYDNKSSLDIVNAIAVDNQNNVYATGWTGVYPVLYHYLIKFSPNGTVLWKERDGLDMFGVGQKIVVDKNQNIYVVAYFTERGQNAIRVLKYKPNGERDWNVWIYGPQYGYRGVNDLFFDSNENLYITGYFSNYITSGSFSLTSPSSNFILKVSNTGTRLWLKAIPEGSRVKVSQNGEIYFTSGFAGSTNVDGNYLYSAGNQDILFGKYDTNGSLSWVKRAGGQGLDKASSLAVDNNGDMYITGSFSGNAWFDTTPANAVDSEDYFLAKYRSDGLFLWIRNGGGQGIDTGVQVEISTDNHPIVLGSRASNNLVFYPNVGLNATIAPSNFMIKHHSNTGNIIWVKAIEFASYFKINSVREIYVLGNFGQSSSESRIISKYGENGELIYRQVAGALISAFSFGTKGHFFYAGEFGGAIQIGGSILTNSTDSDNLYISHWIE